MTPREHLSVFYKLKFARGEFQRCILTIPREYIVNYAYLLHAENSLSRINGRSSDSVMVIEVEHALKSYGLQEKADHLVECVFVFSTGPCIARDFVLECELVMPY